MLWTRLRQSDLSEIKEEGKTKRNADGQQPEEWQPQSANAQPLALRANEKPQDQGRHEHVHGEERADAISEKQLEEPLHLKSIPEDPGDKLPIRKNGAHNAQQEINSLELHVSSPFTRLEDFAFLAQKHYGLDA
jgi:hypothetical protein